MSATNRAGTKRAKLDQYATPNWAVELILEHLPLSGVVLDAGCGTGAIMRAVARVKAFREERVPSKGDFDLLGVEIDQAAIDEALRQNTPGFIEHGDFLDSDPMRKPSLVIANPPYGKAQEFFEAALEMVVAGGTVAMLLRLNWLAGQARAAFHRMHPTDVYVLSKRPSFTGGGSDATDYGWFVYGPGRGHRWFLLGEGS